jgi:hypothetical protein
MDPDVEMLELPDKFDWQTYMGTLMSRKDLLSKLKIERNWSIWGNIYLKAATGFKLQ